LKQKQQELFLDHIIEKFFWSFVGTCLLLSWVSGKPVEYPYFEICKLTTFLYFFILGFLIPFVIAFENKILTQKGRFSIDKKRSLFYVQKLKQLKSKYFTSKGNKAVFVPIPDGSKPKGPIPEGLKPIFISDTRFIDL